jgi:hypothetical protein
VILGAGFLALALALALVVGGLNCGFSDQLCVERAVWLGSGANRSRARFAD